MNRKHISHSYGDYDYYLCSTYKKMNQGACTKHTIRSDRLEIAVLAALQQQIALAVEMDELIEAINAEDRCSQQSRRLADAIVIAQRKRSDIERMKLELYPDWKNGDISREEYLALKEKFETELALHNRTLETLHEQQDELAQGVDSNNSFLSQFKQYRNLERLSREVVLSLIDMIYIHEGAGITIDFNFSDSFQLAREYIEINQ